MSLRVAALLTHPVQYYSPWLARLAEATDLMVYYAHRQCGEGQAAAGFGVAFDWDVPLLEGYRHRFLENVATRPGLARFGGCDTPEIAPILRAERYDALLLFGWNKKSLMQGWLGALRSNTPVFVRLDSQYAAQRSPLKRMLKRLIYPPLLSWSADYLSPGARTDDYLRRHGVAAARIYRLPHMIDTERFSAGAAAARISGSAETRRASWGAERGDFVFLYVGKLVPKKRPELLLAAFRAAGLRAARLVFVGDGPLRAALETEADGDPRVHFAGFVNQAELPEVYAAADCLVLPSNAEETWGLVVNEAQACGLPAIVSVEAGSAPELIEDGRTGWTLRSPDPTALAALLRTAADARLAGADAIAARSAASSFAEGVRRMVEIVQARQRHG
jgi:glycosyltransferase involved in cell wall biosynthesis